MADENKNERHESTPEPIGEDADKKGLTFDRSMDIEGGRDPESIIRTAFAENGYDFDVFMKATTPGLVAATKALAAAKMSELAENFKNMQPIIDNLLNPMREQLAAISQVLEDCTDHLDLLTAEQLDGIKKQTGLTIEQIKDMEIPKLIGLIEDLEEKARRADKYFALSQNTQTNSVTQNLSTRLNSPDIQLMFTGEEGGVQRGVVKSKDFELIYEGINELKSSPSATKLFNTLMCQYTADGNELVEIPLSVYMEMRGLKDVKHARAQIRNDIAILRAVSFKYKKKTDWEQIHLYGGRAGLQNGVIIFRFTPEFAHLIPKNQFMYLPAEYFKINDKLNPYASSFVYRAAQHKRSNVGKTNENNIGVSTLLNSAPNFPKYSDSYVQRRFGQKILIPFERDMDSIESLKWNYKGDSPTTYTEFLKATIELTWAEDYPEMVVLRENKNQKKSPKPTNKTTKKTSPKT